MGRGANTRLADLLALADWSAARLAAELNRVLGPGQVSRSTVAAWASGGHVPHDPMPTLVTHLLAQQLGEDLTPADLWGPATAASPHWSRADDLPAPTALGATDRTAAHWIEEEGRRATDRRHFLALTGSALTGPAWAVAAAAPPPEGRLPAPATGAAITPAIADLLAANVEQLRRLDDAEGGDPDTLAYAHSHFIRLAGYLHGGRADTPAVRTRVINLWAQLAQTIGWMAQDASLHGLGQRYYRTALTAAHASGDRALCSHVMGCMAYQAVMRGQPRDAVHLAGAAIETSRDTAPAVQALAHARYAHAVAALGDDYGLRAATETAQTLLARPGMLTSRPPWLYWVDTLHVVTAQTMLTAGLAPGMHPRQRRQLLEQAEAPITAWLGAGAEHTDSRDALLHGTWLARGYLARGDIDTALATTRHLTDYATTVRSTSARRLLADLATDLRRRDLAGHHDVDDTLRRLDVLNRTTT